MAGKPGMDGAATAGGSGGAPGDSDFNDTAALFHREVKKRKRKGKHIFGKIQSIGMLNGSDQEFVAKEKIALKTQAKAAMAAGDVDGWIPALHKTLVNGRRAMNRALEQGLQNKGDFNGTLFQAAKSTYFAWMHVMMYVLSLITYVAMRMRGTLVTDQDFAAAGIEPNTNPLNTRRGKFWAWNPATNTFQSRPWKAGSMSSIEKFGLTSGSATDQQLSNRIQMGYTGPGALIGRWAGQGLGSIARRIPGIGSHVADALPQAMSDGEDWLLHKYMGAGKYDTTAYDSDGYSDDSDDSAVRQANSHGPKGVGGGVAGGEYNGSPFLPDGSVSKSYRDTRFHGNQIINPDSLFSRNTAKIYTADDESGDLIIHHREFLRDVKPKDSGFTTVDMIEINAGLETSFPLLSKFARYYGEYEFHQLIVRYRTTLSPGNDAATGTVAIGTLYNPDAPKYTSKRAIENAEYTASGRVIDVIHCGVECDPKKMAHTGMYYTRRGPLGSANDLHTYDMGKVQITTSGAQANVPVGELWVEYKVRLSKLTNTTLMDPLSKGEGLSMSMVYPAPVSIGLASSQWHGSNREETGLAPFPGWKASTELGQLQTPGVYRWNASSIAAGYEPGRGSKLPISTGLRNVIPMVAGYSSTPNMGFALEPVSSTSPAEVSYAFQSVPGAVYTWSLTLTTAYEADSMLENYGAAPAASYDSTIAPLTNNNLGIITAGAIGPQPGGTNSLSAAVPTEMLSHLFHRGGDRNFDCGTLAAPTILPSGYDCTNPLPSDPVNSFGLVGSQSIALVALQRYRFVNGAIGPGVANTVADYVNDLKFIYEQSVAPLIDELISTIPAVGLKTIDGSYGGAAVQPADMNWGSLTFSIVQGPARFVGGTTEVTVPLRLVDGGQFTFNTNLLQCAISCEVTGNTGGQVVLRVAPSGGGFPTTYSSPYVIGPRFPTLANTATAIYAGSPGQSIDARYKVSSTTLSFKRVK